MASVVGDDSTNPASPNPDDNEGHKEASGKKKKNRCLSCKKKVGLTGNERQTLVHSVCFISNVYKQQFLGLVEFLKKISNGLVFLQI